MPSLVVKMKYGLLFVWALVLCSCMGLSYKTFQEWSSSCNICQHESMADGKCTVDNYGQSTVTLVQCCYSVVAGRDMGYDSVAIDALSTR